MALRSAGLAGRFGVLLLVGAALASGAARAQAPGAAANAASSAAEAPPAAGATPLPPGHPALPAPGAAQGETGDGVIEGRVVGALGESGAGGLDVVLYAVPQDSAPRIAYGVTRDDGSFRFEGVAPDPATAYLVGVRSEGVPFGTRARFAPGMQRIEVVIEVLARSNDRSNLARAESTLRIDPACQGIELSESHPLVNTGRTVLFVPPEERAQGAPLLEFELPDTAQGLATPLGALPEGLERSGSKLRYWGPLHPGEQTLDFSYGVALDEAGRVTLSRRLRAGDPALKLRVHEGGLRLVDSEARDIGHERIDDQPYWSARLDTRASDEIHRFAIERRSAEIPPLRLRRSGIYLEVDDATLEVQEQHLFEITAPTKGAGPLLCLPLPENADALRFDAASLALGASTDPSGALALHGPLEPGEHRLSLAYRLPADENGARFRRRFGQALSLLSIELADTGVIAHSDRLHRLRAARGDGRNYLRLEAFSIGADEEIAIDLERLPAPRPLPRMASFGALLLLAALALAALLAPLRRAAQPGAAAQAPDTGIASEVEALRCAMRDLDEDFETGKLSAADHAELREELRQRGAQLLRAEGAGTAESSPTTTGAAAAAQASDAASRPPHAQIQPGDAASAQCGRCGAQTPADARFCPQCGNPLGAGGGAG